MGAHAWRGGVNEAERPTSMCAAAAAASSPGSRNLNARAQASRVDMQCGAGSLRTASKAEVVADANATGMRGGSSGVGRSKWVAVGGSRGVAVRGSKWVAFEGFRRVAVRGSKGVAVGGSRGVAAAVWAVSPGAPKRCGGSARTSCLAWRHVPSTRKMRYGDEDDEGSIEEGGFFEAEGSVEGERSVEGEGSLEEEGSIADSASDGSAISREPPRL